MSDVVWQCLTEANRLTPSPLFYYQQPLTHLILRGKVGDPHPPKSALEIIGTLNIDSAKTNIDAGVANLIRVSLSMIV